MITFENWLYISLGGVLGYLLRVFTEHFLAKSRSREEHKHLQFANAASEFRNTVISELTGLYPEALDFPRDIGVRLSKSLPRIQAAVAVFSHHLDHSKSAEFQQAWRSFQESCSGEIPTLCSAAQIMYGDGSIAKAKEVLKIRIDALLKHAAML